MKSRIYAIAFAALLATGLAATKFTSSLPAPIVNGVLEQVVNPKDLCNGYMLDGCPVAIDDQRLVDQQAWLVEEAGATSVQYVTERNDCVVAGAACLAFQPTSVVFWKGDKFVKTDIRGVVMSSAAVRIDLLQTFGAKQSEIALKWYPGFEARHPSQGNPIGDPWPDHPYAKQGRKMFHSLDARNTWSPGSTFQLDQRRWIKWRSALEGCPFMSTNCKVTDSWEETTLR